MERTLADSSLWVCACLNKHAVEYMIVGGTAVALHGYFRRSMNAAGVLMEKPDLDFWYNPSYPNYFRLLDALEELGQDVKEFKEEHAPNPKQSFFRFNLEHFTLDFLPELAAPIKFSAAYPRRAVVNLNNESISFISFYDLIADKEATSRAKDKQDIDALKKARENDGQ